MWTNSQRTWSYLFRCFTGSVLWDGSLKKMNSEQCRYSYRLEIANMSLVPVNRLWGSSTNGLKALETVFRLNLSTPNCAFNLRPDPFEVLVLRGATRFCNFGFHWFYRSKHKTLANESNTNFKPALSVSREEQLLSAVASFLFAQLRSLVTEQAAMSLDCC